MAKRGQFKITARVACPDGTTRLVQPIGRDAWALDELAKAGPKGVTPIDVPGPRWSAYIFKLRTVYGIGIRTIEEKHGGTFAGSHARYQLTQPVEVIARHGGAAE